MFFQLPHIFRVKYILFIILNGQFVAVEVENWLPLAKLELKQQVTAISHLDALVITAYFERNTIRSQLGIVKEAASGWTSKN